MKKILSLVIVLISVMMIAQNKPAYWTEVQKFKEIDAKQAPAQNVILFLGSSSFTMWQDAEDFFPGKTIINRAFGGSSLKDLNYYHEDLLKPYQPKQIVIYCGENDFASEESLKAKVVLKRFKTFYASIKEFHPNVPVVYVSAKMSPSRKHLWKQFAESNDLIEKFLKKKKETYIDINKAMEDSNGNPRPELYLDDMLHMKKDGYLIWAKVMAPYLK